MSSIPPTLPAAKSSVNQQFETELLALQKQFNDHNNKFPDPRPIAPTATPAPDIVYVTPGMLTARPTRPQKIVPLKAGPSKAVETGPPKPKLDTQLKAGPSKPRKVGPPKPQQTVSPKVLTPGAQKVGPSEPQKTVKKKVETPGPQKTVKKKVETPGSQKTKATKTITPKAKTTKTTATERGARQKSLNHFVEVHPFIPLTTKHEIKKKLKIELALSQQEVSQAVSKFQSAEATIQKLRVDATNATANSQKETSRRDDQIKLLKDKITQLSQQTAQPAIEDKTTETPPVTTVKCETKQALVEQKPTPATTPSPRTQAWYNGRRKRQMRRDHQRGRRIGHPFMRMPPPLMRMPPPIIINMGQTQPYPQFYPQFTGHF